MRHALLLLPLVSCADSPTGSPSTPTRVVEAASFPAIEHRELDLMFQVDNSGGTADIQRELARALPSLLAAIGTADLHIGVATSDLGSSGAEPVGVVGQGGCAGFGDDGKFRTSGAPVRGSFVIHGDTRNYDGELRDVLSQMLQIGSSGCGFEQPLAATRRALQVNDGFVRSTSSLAIVILADEDDCSIADPAFLTKDESVLGPLTSFRCTREGVSCDESMLELGEKHNCRTNTASRWLADPAKLAGDLAALKPRERATLSALIGPPSPVVIQQRQVNGQNELALGHLCETVTPVGGFRADPAVRMAELVESFASRGSLETMCGLEWSARVSRIGMASQRSLGIACLDTSKLADSLDAPGLQPACEARDVTADNVARELPRCPAAGDCFDFVEDPRCADRLRIVIDRKTAPAADTRVDVFCERAVTP